jgi:phosphate/sulfate permease
LIDVAIVVVAAIVVVIFVVVVLGEKKEKKEILRLRAKEVKNRYLRGTELRSKLTPEYNGLRTTVLILIAPKINSVSNKRRRKYLFSDVQVYASIFVSF